MSKVYKNKDWLQEHYHEQGLTTSGCGQLAGCSAGTISYWLKKFGVHKKSALYQDRDWLQKQYCEQGLSARECAKRAGCGETAIWVRLKKLGIRRRKMFFQERDWLQRHYSEQGLLASECGELIGRSSDTILYWLDKTDIPRHTLNYVTKKVHARGAYDDMYNEEFCKKQSEARRIAWSQGIYDGETTRQEYSETTKATWMRGAYDDIYTEETREKISKGLKAAHARGDFDGVSQSPTSIEIAISKALDTAGIEHVKQFRPDGCRFVYDEHLPTLGVLIEINGDYWHSLPGAPERDARKAPWARNHDFLPVTIWEHEIKEHGALAMVRDRITGNSAIVMVGC